MMSQASGSNYNPNLPQKTNFCVWQNQLEFTKTLKRCGVSGTGGSSDTIADYFSQLTQSEVMTMMMFTLMFTHTLSLT